MRDEDDILKEISALEDEKYVFELTNFKPYKAMINKKLENLNKELTEWRFTHGEKVY